MIFIHGTLFLWVEYMRNVLNIQIVIIIGTIFSLDIIFITS